VKAEVGVGQAVVRIPESLGVNLKAETGVGSLTTKGLKLEGSPLKKSVVGATLNGRTSSEPMGRSLSVTAGTGDVRIEGTSEK
jgi:hypothetical protein